MCPPPAALTIAPQASLPSGDSVIDFFRGLYQGIAQSLPCLLTPHEQHDAAIVNFVVSAPANVSKFAEEHPDDVKVGGIILLVVVALVGLFFVTPLLLPVFSAIGTCLASVGKAIVIGNTAFPRRTQGTIT